VHQKVFGEKLKTELLMLPLGMKGIDGAPLPEGALDRDVCDTSNSCIVSHHAVNVVETVVI
jgi:hypothetical protein